MNYKELHDQLITLREYYEELGLDAMEKQIEEGNASDRMKDDYMVALLKFNDKRTELHIDDIEDRYIEEGADPTVILNYERFVLWGIVRNRSKGGYGHAREFTYNKTTKTET